MGMLRTTAASYWTALGLGVAAIVLHVRWYTVDKAWGGEVVSGLGAALVVLGVLVASRPYVRLGYSGLVQAGLPKSHAGVWGGPVYDASVAKLQDEARPQVVRDVWAERIVAVAVVVLGTLLNGYGPLVARVLHLR